MLRKWFSSNFEEKKKGITKNKNWSSSGGGTSENVGRQVKIETTGPTCKPAEKNTDKNKCLIFKKYNRLQKCNGLLPLYFVFHIDFNSESGPFF